MHPAVSRRCIVLRGLSLFTAVILAACSGDEAPPALVIGGIPDQDVSVLEERFGGIAGYLSDELGVPVEYRPSIEYAPLVTAFKNGDIQLAWFGGLTGVQARRATPGAEAIAQRPRDKEFTSAFIVNSRVEAETLEDLRGLSFTFGSTNSTSGHLMPRFFLRQAGIDPEADFDGPPNFSGSHDLTWKLVEQGSFDAGALNSAVWRRAVERGQVDMAKVRLLAESPQYADYHWVSHPVLDDVYGQGFTGRLEQALLDMSPEVAEEKAVLDLFQTDAFIPTGNSNYEAIERVAIELGFIE